MTIKTKKTTFIKDATNIPTSRLNIKYYNTDGKFVEEETAVAKEVKYSKGSKYFILVSKKNKLFNPIIDKMNAKAIRGGGALPEFNMKEVDDKTFQRYISFLETKNTYLLNQAELLRGR